ncbi:MAG: CBS domain-containing protein [Nanoarchaeota archaeon]
MATISRIMSADVPKLNKDASISDATELIANNPNGCVVIVEDKKPIGIITESDIIKNLVFKKASSKDKVIKIMSAPITSLSPSTKLEKANKIIDTKHFRRYPVVEQDNLVGIITENSIVQAINDNIRFHRNLQNATIVIFVLFELFVFIFYKNLANFFL